MSHFDPAAAIAALDAIIAEQLDAIMQHPALIALEQRWRSLAFLVERVDFEQNIRPATIR